MKPGQPGVKEYLRSGSSMLFSAKHMSLQITAGARHFETAETDFGRDLGQVLVY